MKELIRGVFNRFGYDIIKTGIPYLPKTKKPVRVKVGKFEIEMPGNNVQRFNYAIFPDLNFQIGRLASIISQKYPDITAIDIGANVGDTIAILKSFVNVPVVGIEGDDISFRFLKRNIQQFSDVTVIKSYLGEKSDNITVNMSSVGWNNTIAPSEKGTEYITIRTLDEVLDDEVGKKSNYKLLKSDVEGFDTLVLRGASETIEKSKPVLFFEYNRNAMKKIGEDGLSTIFTMRKFGYEKIVFFDHIGNLILSTTLEEKEVITHLHDYISYAKNLLGYYDIVLFNEADIDIAEQYINGEKKFLQI